MLPNALLRRLPEYYKTFNGLLMEECYAIKSTDLAKIMRIRATTIRRDFSYLGDLGRQGFGYDIRKVLGAIKAVLCVQKSYNAAIIGFGNLGKAFTYYNIHKEETYIKEGLTNYPLKITAAFDQNEEIVETSNAIPTFNITELERILSEKEIEVVVLAIPAHATQGIVSRLKKTNIKGILNFSSTFIDVPSSITLRHADLFSEVQSFVFDVTNPKVRKEE